jgi:hypothetical protein
MYFIWFLLSFDDDSKGEPGLLTELFNELAMKNYKTQPQRLTVVFKNGEAFGPLGLRHTPCSAHEQRWVTCARSLVHLDARTNHETDAVAR